MVIESLTLSLTTIWFGISGFLMVFLAFTPLPFPAQLFIFVVVALLLLIFKYHDYYTSTGRYNVHLADTYEEACTMEPQPLPDLKPLQEAVMAVFPYDLWEQK